VAGRKPETANHQQSLADASSQFFDEHSKACLREAGKHFGRKSRMMSRSIVMTAEKAKELEKRSGAGRKKEIHDCRVDWLR
jgi:hypothetical protein